MEEAKNSKVVQFFKRLKSMRSGTIFLVLILLVILASVISPGFLKVGNLVNVIRNISIDGILAIGMTFVLLTGGIDLSVGSTMGIVAVTVGTMFQAGLAVPLVVIAALFIGIAVGAINGLGITRGGVTPFIMTLGTMTAFRGLAMYIANGSPISWRDSGIDFKFLGQGDIFGIPAPVFVFIAVFAIAFITLKYTYFGRSVYAIGDSRETARLSGINVFRSEMLVYMTSGLLAAVAMLVLISRLSVGEPQAGDGYELNAIAMSVIGGTSTAGGVGGVTGTLIGAALLSVLQNILNLVGISPFIQQVIKGVIIIFAVLVEGGRKKKSK